MSAAVRRLVNTATMVDTLTCRNRPGVRTLMVTDRKKIPETVVAHGALFVCECVVRTKTTKRAVVRRMPR